MITSAEEFIRLRTSEEPAEYNRAAHEEAPTEVWWKLVPDYPDIKLGFSITRRSPLRILDALSNDEDVAGRGTVARKRKASAEILHRLARDPDSGVRYAVACNPKAPYDVLKVLADDEWETIALEAKARLRVDL